jgi:phage tail-like protein
MSGETITGRRMIDSLPAIYQEQAALAAFLSAFDEVLFGAADPQAGPPGIAGAIDGVATLLDPRETREEFLAWLGTWVALTMGAELEPAIRRELIARAVAIYRWRGTRRGMEELIALVTGGRATVREPELSTLQIGAARVGSTTRLGRDLPHYFEVIVESAGGAGGRDATERRARAFVDYAKPAHTYYTLTVR